MSATQTLETAGRTAPVPLERLEHEIISMAGDLAAAEAQWLFWIAEYDRRAGWESWGCRSCAHWLNWKCGVSVHAAQEKVRTGRALLELPTIAEAFLAGRISYSKVRALTRVADAGNETTLLELAFSMTASQLERACAACRRAGSDRRAAEAFNSRRVTRRSLGDGLSRITSICPMR